MSPIIRDRETGEEHYVSSVETEGDLIKTNRGDVYNSRNVDVKGNQCFIATAVGSDEQSLDILRAYRDEILTKKYLGRQFVRCYYIVSPFIASKIVKSATTKKIIKTMFIDKLVLYAKKVVHS